MSIPPQGNTSTAIVEAGTAVAGATANTVLYVDALGLLASEAAFTYDESTDTLTALNVVASTTLKASNLSAGLMVYTGTGGLLSAESTFAYNASTNVLGLTGRINLIDGGAARSTFVGEDAGSVNAGADNAGFGYNALKLVEAGGLANTACGSGAADALTTGDNNAAFGFNSLSACVTGIRNTALGDRALLVATASQNTAVGSAALFSTVDGGDNVAVGMSTMFTNVSGVRNTAVGLEALFTATGSDNVAVGWKAARATTDGTRLTALGQSALTSNTGEDDSTAVGFEALTLATGGSNTAVGSNAGDVVTTGTQCTFLGMNAGSTGTTNNLTNAAGIGYNAQVTASNTMQLGAAAKVQCDAGAGTGKVVLSGKADINTTAVGNVGTGEDNLMTFSLPTDSFNAAGRSVRITATGTNANNAAAKTLKLYFGSQVASVSLTANQAGVWKFVAHVTSTGTDTQDYNYEFFQDGATEIRTLAEGTLTENDGAAIVIKCTGEATNNDDIVQGFMLVEFFN